MQDVTQQRMLKFLKEPQVRSRALLNVDIAQKGLRPLLRDDTVGPCIYVVSFDYKRSGWTCRTTLPNRYGR